MTIRDKILIIEDEQTIANFMRAILETRDYEVMIVQSGAMASTLIASHCPDLIILDLGLPDMDGMTILRNVRKWSKVPILVVSARSHERDKVEALDAGADDYLTKPFEIIELLARVESVLRRYHKTEQILREGELVIDTASRTVTRNGEELRLTKKEFELLLLFVRNKNIALYRDTIYERIWGGEYMGDSRTVDLHVQRMRKKTGLEEEIKTVYKVGYRYSPDTGEKRA